MEGHQDSQMTRQDLEEISLHSARTLLSSSTVKDLRVRITGAI